MSTAGNWTLQITDNFKFNSGTLNSWSLIVQHPPAVATPGITVTPTSGLITTEAGGTATFDVVLDTEPTEDVMIAISSSDTTEGTPNTTMLTFDSGNWNIQGTIIQLIPF